MNDCMWRMVMAILAGSSLIGSAAGGQETLLTIAPTAQHPRHSEGDILPLTDGRLCLVYSRFSGGDSDFAAADLVMRVSADGGQTWGEDRVVVSHESGCNVMSASLLRLKDGRIALFYLRKESLEDCRPMLCTSTDEGQTFSTPQPCITDEIGYYVLNNDRALQLDDGRLLLPVARHNVPGQPEPDWGGRLMVYRSDDAGRAWQRSQSELIGKSPTGERVTVQEPGIVPLADGRLMMYCRTNDHCQYVSHSTDGGVQWTELAPASLASPLSPATIKRIPDSDDLLCIWNDHSGVHPFPVGKRSPLCVAVSRDHGRTWSRSLVLEGDPEGWFCYTSLTFLAGGNAVLSYCAGDPEVGHLNRLKVVTLPNDQIARLRDREPAVPCGVPLLEPCLDYGRSFVNTKAVWNSPRFWVESRCRVVDPAAQRTVEYLQCGLCKAERTFAFMDLFSDDNYDFLPVFTQDEGIIFRRKVRVHESYREVRPIEKWWEGTEPRLLTKRARVLKTPDEIFAAMQAGDMIVGQTELHDPASGRTAVLEFPIKTINYHRETHDWQIDTGPVVLPDLSVPPEEWSQKFQLAFIAFRTPYWADFLTDQPTQVDPQDENSPRVYHYSGKVHHITRNVLLALEP